LLSITVNTIELYTHLHALYYLLLIPGMRPSLLYFSRASY